MSNTKSGIVVIGRNEGARLERCLSSLSATGLPFVYVDSGSTDGSLLVAKRFGSIVVELDMSRPFTAARARNAGFEALTSTVSDIGYVQFIDGDCTLAAGWLDTARAFLDAHPDVAIACGRRRELSPGHSIYNRMCDIEWNTPIGEAQMCGGDFLIRAAAFESVGGFRAELIAGEEPDLCLRLTKASWRIWRLDHEMTLHDAAISTFSQWWRRMVRSGHAFAEVTSLHSDRDFAWHRNVRSALAWTGILAAPLAGALVDGRLALAALVIPLQVHRIARRQTSGGKPDYLYGALILIGKVAETWGILKFHGRRLRRGKSGLIEYK